MNVTNDECFLELEVIRKTVEDTIECGLTQNNLIDTSGGLDITKVTQRMSNIEGDQRVS